MKLLPLLLVLAACNQKAQAPVSAGSGGSAGSAAPAAPAVKPSPPASDDVCRMGMDAIDHASCGSAASKLTAARKSLEAIVTTAQNTGTTDPHAYEITCARLVDAIDRDGTKAGCSLTIDPALRARIAKDVDEYYAQRTPVTPTGDAASDAVITKVAAMRDAACACKDQKCLDKVDDQLVTIPAMPATAPQAAKDLTTKLLDDASRCAQRVKLQ